MNKSESTQKMDMLGRVCIPAELRKKCNINGNDKVEISLCNGIISIRKFVPRTYSLVGLLKQAAHTMAEALHAKVFIADGEQILASSVALSVCAQWAAKARQILKQADKYAEMQCLKIDGCRFIKRQITAEMGVYVQCETEFTECRSEIWSTCTAMLADIFNWLSVRE